MNAEMERKRDELLKPLHLGDGAYLTWDGYGFTLTANHHDPAQATDRVYIDGIRDMRSLIERVQAIENLVKDIVANVEHD